MDSPMDWPWKTRGIIHEFFVANLLGNPWKTHGIFHDEAVGESMENSWNTP